jgi:hypothetical protein
MQSSEATARLRRNRGKPVRSWLLELLLNQGKNLFLILDDGIEARLVLQNGGLILFYGVLIGFDLALIGDDLLLIPENLFLICDDLVF